MFVLQEPLKKELESIQKQHIIVPLGVDETLEWCNSFALVLKANGKVGMCLHLPRLIKG